MAMTMDTKEFTVKAEVCVSVCARTCVCVVEGSGHKGSVLLCVLQAVTGAKHMLGREGLMSLEWSRRHVKGSYARVLRGISRTSEPVVSMWVCSEGWCGTSRFWRRYSPWRSRRMLLRSSIVLLNKINRFSMDYGGDWCCLLPLLVGKV